MVWVGLWLVPGRSLRNRFLMVIMRWEDDLIESGVGHPGCAPKEKKQ